jgi:outer membrane receptor for ferrienterochelin and colicin
MSAFHPYTHAILLCVLAAGVLAAGVLTLVPTSASAQEEYDVHVQARKSRFEHAGERKDVVAGEELEKNGVTTLEEAIQQTTAGAQAVSSGNARGVSIDGLGAAQVVLLVNGIPTGTVVNTQAGPMVDLATIQVSPEDIERVELDRGLGRPGATGSGSVTVNVVTKRPTEARLSASSTVRSAGQGVSSQAYRVSGAQPLGALTVTVAGSTDDQRALDVNKDGLYDSPDRRLYGGELKVSYDRPGEKVVASVGTRFGRTDSLGVDLHTRTESFGVDGALTGEWKLTPDTKVIHKTSVRVGSHAFQKVGARDGQVIPKSDTDRLALVQVVQLDLWEGAHNVQPHVSVQGEQIGRGGELGTFGPRWMTRAGAGLRHSVLVLSDRVEIFDGVEVDGSDTYGAGWGAEGGVAVYATEWLTAQSKVYRSRRLPIAEELSFDFDHSEVGYRLFANPDLAPEVTNSIHAGVVLGNNNNPVRLEVSGFVSEVQDHIVTLPLEGGADGDRSYANTDATMRGVNSGVRLQLPAQVLLEGSHSWLPVANDSAGKRLLYKAEHTARAQASVRYLKRKVSSSVQVQWRSDLPVKEGEVEAPGPTLIRLGTEAAVGRGFRVGVALENALNQTNATWGPRVGRSGMIRLSYVSSK